MSGLFLCLNINNCMSKHRENPETGEPEFWCPIDKKWMPVKDKKSTGKSFKDFMETQLNVDDHIENMNPSCEHYGSTGIIKAIKKLPEIGSAHVKSKHNTPGVVAIYKVDNQGDTFKPGDLLTKTIIQLRKTNDTSRND